MSEIFLKIINMSISASYIVLAVLLLRLLLRKAPKWITVLLWGIVAVRLICPFSVESVLSLIPSAEVVSPDIMMNKTPTIHTGIPIINSTLNPVISESFTPNPGDSANPLQIWIPVLTTVWIIGMAALFVYTAISYARVRRRIGTAVLYKDNIYQSENVVSPFVLGLIHTKIYLPFIMNDKDMEHVVAHEMAHIRRKDHLWKPLGFLLLTLHWFNPLMWLGYVLLCRDIELACDEKVIGELDHDARADYSEALLTCSVKRRMIAACPLALGEVGVQQRVKSVLNYKKPAFWIVVLAVIACITVAVCFLTNPPQTISIESISRVTWNDMDVSEEYVQNLVSMIRESRCSYFPVGADDPNDLSVSVQIHCDDGSMYLLHYQYYSGFSFSPAHPGEDDYRSILTYFSPDGKGSKAWKLEYDFDAKFKKWLVAVRADPGIPYIPETDMQSGKQLTLDDVITLSSKGYDLTWEDFAPYTCRDVGSGLYICHYEIDDIFHLLVGDGKLTGTPMYIRLKLNNGDDYADVTKDDVAAFINEHISVKISVDSSISVPEPVMDYALSMLQSHIDTYNGYGESQKAVTGTTYTITEAKITSISRFNTGTAGLSDACYLYKMECLLKPTETDPANIFLAGGMLLEDGWFKIVQPYFAMYQSWSEGEDTWKPMGVIDELTIATEYGTDEMLAKYGNMYTAALMEMLGSFEGRSRQHITITEIPKDMNMVLEDRRYIFDENEYTRYILVSVTEHFANEKFTNIRLISMALGENGMEPDQVHYTFPELTHEKPLLIGVVFYGDMTTYGFMFTDENGNEYSYLVYESGKDGSICLQQMN